MNLIASLLKKEWLWLALFSLILVYSMSSQGELTTEESPDSGGYISMSDQPLGVDSLMKSRTIGYPLLLKVCRVFLADEQIPLFQLLLFVGSVFLFSFALKRLGITPICNVGICATLFYKTNMMDMARFIMTDFPGYACSIMIAACLIAVIKPRAHQLWWVGLTVALFCGYQIRPVYLCLIPAVIVGLVVGRWLYERGHTEEVRTKYLRFASLSLAVAIIPFIGFCSLRYALVGHFGLVSFGGYNTVGIAGSLLEEEDIAQLSPPSKRLAKVILEKRNDPEIRKKNDYQESSWQPIIIKGEHWNHVDYQNYVAQYNFIIWRISVPAANDIIAAELGSEKLKEQIAQTNILFSKFSREVLLLHISDYIHILGRSLWSSIDTFFNIIVQQEIHFIKRIFRAWFFLFVCRLLYNFLISRFTGIPPVKNRQAKAVTFVVTVVSLLFFLSNIGLVIAVEIPIYRYVAPAAGLLPAIAMTFFFYEIELARLLFIKKWGHARESQVDCERNQKKDNTETNLKMTA